MRVISTKGNEKCAYLSFLESNGNPSEHETYCVFRAVFSIGERFIAEGIQNRTRHEALRRWGCYFFALYRWAQELNHGLGPKDYVVWYNRCVAAGHVIDDPARNKRAFIQNAAEVMNMMVGKRLFSRVRHVPEKPGGMSFFPVRVQNGGTAHFILMVKHGEVWDSLGGGPYPVVNFREIK